MVLENGIFTCKIIKLNRCLALITKINLKCIKDLYVSPETIKILEENVGKNFLTLVLGMIFYIGH